MHRSSGARTAAVAFAATRRVVLAVVVASLTLAGHAAGQGTLPGTVGIGLAVLIATGLAFTAASRPRSWLWLLLFLLGAQVLIHAVLMVAMPHAHASAGSASLVPTGSAAVAHGVASVVAAVVLARGDAVLQSWTSLLVTRLGVDVPVESAPRPPVTGDPMGPQWHPVTSEHRWDVARRGPPAIACVWSPVLLSA